MISTSEARVSTENAKRYAAQTGKHWAHDLSVEEVGDTRIITFPRDARWADWPGEARVKGLKGAAERHVDRFALREAPLVYDWIDGDVPSS